MLCPVWLHAENQMQRGNGQDCFQIFDINPKPLNPEFVWQNKQ